ncbi:Ring-type e3 ubiquitin transferase [Thalictrum thalictroides]|uniref:U-box domain-containing protein n=1 Tax=Thalictrum thalictroides TaxID=46969 RepID=A0A7J6WED5_THATH|nr:Ring-type e3 ubiquitin transferase [Thalictrum thalictroides]
MEMEDELDEMELINRSTLLKLDGQGMRKLAMEYARDVVKKELEKELKQHVEEINSETTECAKMAYILAKAALRKEFSHLMPKPSNCPNHFCCPISGCIMIDPVLASTGMSYERKNIEVWRKAGIRKCPKTRLYFTSKVLVQNQILKVAISEWCQNKSIDLSNYLSCN